MKQQKVTIVRVYLSEGEGQLEGLVKRLKSWEKVRGLTVFRGIEGFGESGKLHSSALLNLSLDLPVVVEFFDEPNIVKQIVEHIQVDIKPGHIVMWDAKVNI